MVSKCANPQCNRQFLNSSQGKLFLVDRQPGPLIENVFWLCPECAVTYSIVLDGFSRPVLCGNTVPDFTSMCALIRVY